jgi:hypothetical protein
MRPGQKLIQVGGTLQTLQTRVESGGGKCPNLNGVLVRPDHSVSLRLEDPKSEALVVVNIGGDGAVPCVTIEPLIHTVHSILRGRSRDTTWRQLKNYIAIIRRWQVLHFVISDFVIINRS